MTEHDIERIAPFTNCQFKYCDLIGQCKSEGKCHHPRAEKQGEYETLKKDAERMEYKLKLVMPLFEEARDALCAIPLASAKLHSVRLDLADRMDFAGTITKAEIDEAIDKAKEI
jgi:hypothetical protein